MEGVVLVLDDPARSLGEENSPLEGGAVQTLALSTMAVFCVNRVAVDFEDH
jgi:hypothetical protein